MSKAVATYTDKGYLEQRRNLGTSYGYGLMRRTKMTLDMVRAHAPARPLDFVDFGCADGAMLMAAAEELGTGFRSGLGLDVFRSGVPAANTELRINYVAGDLFTKFPFPVADESIDVAIASAFFKHNPNPGMFMNEVQRMLRPGGILIMLDPRPYVVNMGARLGRFNKGYIPTLWAKQYVMYLLEGIGSQLKLKDFQRYWIAPNYGTYKMGIERLMPRFFANWVALHQCIVLVK